jgi:hypothetical protein
MSNRTSFSSKSYGEPYQILHIVENVGKSFQGEIALPGLHVHLRVYIVTHYTPTHPKCSFPTPPPLFQIHVECSTFNVQCQMFNVQCINVSMHQCINVSMYQCINASMHQCINASIHQCINVSMHQCINVSMYQCINVSMYQCINVSMYA